ncbi:hypothetical protein [Legionella tunisiensis]|uniref:hypothetical protein n=1 Tax=Legionella tunisiensis TaxID=1034944 RepID=UPI0002E43BA7|nr:hypothetical protein [Legionella tunisiensis]
MNIIEHVEGLVSGKIRIIKLVTRIIKLEAKLAGLSIYPLLLNVCLLLITLTTLWLSAMLLLGYLFTQLFGNTFLGIFIVLLFNLGFSFLLANYLRSNLEKMSFKKQEPILPGRMPMKNSRKQLIVKIEKLDKNLHQQQMKVQKHYRCLTSFINSTDVLIGLIPAFMIGWGSTKGSFIKICLNT